MKFTLKNKELGATINFLTGLELMSNTDSRHRTKLVKLIVPSFEELTEEEKQLMSKYDLLTLDGKLIPEDKRNPMQVALFNEEQAILYEEEVVIEGGRYARNIDEIPRILAELSIPLSGEHAEIYDKLMDQIEEQTNDIKEEE